ncbi:hypothetical protein B566_EDAN007874 [Ephemera danica]|nr:hypothetical protein B566_EDAN007874 [Ephemera danica]
MTSSQRTPLSAEWLEKYERFNKLREQGFIHVDRGIQLEQEGKTQEAIPCYEAGLESIDKALNIYLENVPHLFWDNYYENVVKMKGTRKQMLSRLADLQNPGVADSAESQFEPTAPSAGRAPPSYDEAMSTSGSSNGEVASPYSQLADNLRQLRTEVEGTVLYVQENVRMYFISPDGNVGSLSSPTTLTIAQYQDDSHSQVHPRYFMQVGDWIYPLLPGLSPMLHSEFGAFIVPDVHSPVADSSVYEIFNDILQGILQESPKKATAAPPPRPPPPQVSEEPAPTSSLSRRISEGILIGAQYLSYGLVKGAEKAGELISSTTPKVMAKIQPDPEPKPIPPNVKKGMKVAKNVTGTAVQVTGFVANKIGSATMALGRWMAPHVQTQGTKLLSRMSGLSEQEAAGKMEGALEVTAGAVQGVSTVYTALERSAGLLATNMCDMMYGRPAGEITDDTLQTVGNAAVAGYTASSLTVKGITKRAAKNAGKAVLEDYTIKKPPDEGEDGAGPSGIEKPPL